MLVLVVGSGVGRCRRCRRWRRVEMVRIFLHFPARKKKRVLSSFFSGRKRHCRQELLCFYTPHHTRNTICSKRSKTCRVRHVTQPSRSSQAAKGRCWPGMPGSFPVPFTSFRARRKRARWWTCAQPRARLLAAAIIIQKLILPCAF